MSDQEKTFIRQLKITLISVLTPFILVAIGNGIVDHHRIRTNKQQIEALKSGMVDQKQMIQYYDKLRRLNASLEKRTSEEYRYINDRMDYLVKEIYQHSVRGVPQELK